MEQRKIGDSLNVSVFGLGTMTFGAEADESASQAILSRYFERGGRFIDTADVYNAGVSEEIIGHWLNSRSIRDELVLATKARFQMGDAPGESGAGEAYLVRALDASLGRLGVDFIDLYQMHAWDPKTPIEETLGVLSGFVRSGKVRALGVSNYTGWQLERAVLTARHGDYAPIVSLQPQYNLLAREIELELLPVCLEENLGVLPWSPLGGGWLTGKYSGSHSPRGETRLGEDPARGVEAYHLKNTDKTWRILSQVESVALSRGVGMSEVALNWVRARPGISSVLLGCRTVDQLDANLDALKWDLDESEMEVLNNVSAPGIPLYPQGFLEHYAGLDIWKDLQTRTAPELAD